MVRRWPPIHPNPSPSGPGGRAAERAAGRCVAGRSEGGTTVGSEGWRYPEAVRTDTASTHHGHRVADPYRWLEDGSDPATGAWVAAQEALFDSQRATWSHLDRWRTRVTDAYPTTLSSTPRMRGTRAFYAHRAAGADHPRLLLREGGTDHTLFDPSRLDPTGRTVLEAWHPSLEGDRLAVLVSAGGTEESFLNILDVPGGAVLDGPIDRVRRSPVAWLPGGRAFYYVRREAPGRHPGQERYHRRVYLHWLGSDPDGDPEIFGAGRDPTQFYHVAVTADGRWLTITASTGTDPNTEVWLADLRACSLELPRLVPVQVGVPARSRLHVRAGTGTACDVFVLTDRGAPRGRIAVTTTNPTVATWRGLVAERPDAVLQDFAILDGPRLDPPLALVCWASHAVSQITVHALTDGRQVGTVLLPGSGIVDQLVVRPEGGHEAWFRYADRTTPPMVLCYDGHTGQVRPWLSGKPAPAAPGGVRTGHVRTGEVKTCQVTYRSVDGTEVGLFVDSPSGRPDRPRPTILTGYGGFGASATPGYLPQALAWTGRGGVYAVACLRGGGEEGEQWHRAGMGSGKQNVFDDFTAAADHLVQAGWTTPDQLGILGGSNGGLLVGAALTQHPEKFAAAVCIAPLLDMVRYELSGFGPSWRPEYGSIADPEEFRALHAYSPYHRVCQGVRYPAVLFAVFESDTRVDPMHARKMCAALQHASTGSGPVLLRLERGVGHGMRARSAAVDLTADAIAFLADQLGLDAGPARR
ncbi:MAG TPA: prolyl oligopeptidase family serine peptidase [Mycobacteriales bacterium]|nr:prolyl oligopeptidase family serine peptidase [Mycobacteriales bacterium]